MKVNFDKRAAPQGGSLTFNLNFDESTLRAQQTPHGVKVDLEGCRPAGEFGGPALPARVMRVALPPMTQATDLQAKVVNRATIMAGPALPTPLQRPRPGAKPRARQDGSDNPDNAGRSPFLRPSSMVPTATPFVEPMRAQSFDAARPELYEEELTRPRPVARLVGSEEIGVTPVALIEVNPVILGDKGQLELATEIEIDIRYNTVTDGREATEIAATGQTGRITSRAQAERMTTLARMAVINPDHVIDLSQLLPQLITNVDYLIITDNHRWNADTIEPIGPANGDLVATFARLATWKAKRGLHSRMVTVSQIVSGTYGDFRAGARDLQEVIRNFIRWAHDRWGISWLLLGGDVNIIPVRRAAGAVLGHISPADKDRPEKNKSYWTGDHLRMHVDRPGDWFPATVDGLTLVNADTGMIIPFDTTGTSGPTLRGWHFCTDDNYFGSPSATPTKYVRVNGPAAEVNATLQWMYNWNMIPTDLYYASLTGPNYGIAGKHDWDLSNNGIYGQHTDYNDLDGQRYDTDISVGRAPVSTADQATAFVNKVIAYESFRKPDGTPLDTSWTSRMLLVSENWSRRRNIVSTPTSPPTDNRYHRAPGANHTLIKLEDIYTDLDRRLLVQVSETDIRELPYNHDADQNNPGWFYAVSATDHSPNGINLNILGTTFHIPIASRWVVVFGSEQELEPTRFIFDRTRADGSMNDQEKLREQVETELPQINNISRLYEDEIDLTPAQVAAAPVEHLTPTRLREKINCGQHFVSLSGHGNSGGCCCLGVGTAGSATNGFHSFIGYADSCLTNQFEHEDAVSEHLLYNAAGGAVAYAGNSRFSWIGVGDDFQRAFFTRLATTTHLGLLHDSRCAMLGSATGGWRRYYKWVIAAMNLMGDPEMPLWLGPPRNMKVKCEQELDCREPLKINVTHRMMWFDAPLAGAHVTIQQGSFLRQAITDGAGNVVFDIHAAHLGNIEVTVTKIGYLPVFQTLEVVGPAWVSGQARVVAHQHGSANATYVQLDLDPKINGAEHRGWYARNDKPDYGIILDAATDAYITKTRIHLLVQNIKEGGTIEHFRFGTWPTLEMVPPKVRERTMIPEVHLEDLTRTPTVSPVEASDVLVSAVADMADLAQPEEAPFEVMRDMGWRLTAGNGGVHAEAREPVPATATPTLERGAIDEAVLKTAETIPVESEMPPAT